MRKEIADAVMKVMIANENADIAPENLVVRKDAITIIYFVMPVIQK